MRLIRQLRLCFRSLFCRAQAEQDLNDELRDYFEREGGHQLAAGAVTSFKEDSRDTRRVRWLEGALTDFHFALRTLRKAPLFTLTVIAALAFCIGLDSSIFSVVDTVLFRPLPFPRQDRLVSLTEGIPGAGFPVVPFSCPDYFAVTANSRSFESAGAWRKESYELSAVDRPIRVEGARLTASLFAVLQIAPLLGRTFTPSEDDAGQVAVLDYRLARSLFQSSANALGRTIHLDRKPYTVIGIMPPSFSFPPAGLKFNSESAAVFVPVSWTKDERESLLNNYNFGVVARLRPSVTVPQAAAEVAAVVKRIPEAYPPDTVRFLQQHHADVALTSEVLPLREAVTGGVRRPLLLLLASAGILLLIGCADVSNLMFSRLIGRRREFALRIALGAGTWRLIRQTLAEGLLLSVAGGIGGFCLVSSLLPLLLHFAPAQLPRLNEIGFNWRMAGFMAAVTLATPLIFCLVPMAGTIRSAIAGRRQRLWMSVSVVLQIGLACLLLITAGLLVRSFRKALETDPGFRPQHVIGARVSLPASVYREPRQVVSFFDRLLTRLNTLPGVLHTGALSDLPMQSSSNRVISAEGAEGSEKIGVVFSIGNALASLQAPLIRGRLLQPADESAAPRAAVISEGLATRLWPRHDPLGRHINFGFDDSGPPVTVVGVVKDIKDRLTSTTPRFVMFTTREDWVREMTLLVRTSSDPLALAQAIRQEVNRLDPDLPIGTVTTLDHELAASLSAERFHTLLLASFAVAALLLATLGLAGLLAYNTTQRMQEFAVRVAVGAGRRHLLALILGRCLRLSAIGVAFGVAASLLLTRHLSVLLYGTSPYDPVTFVAVPSALILVALTGAWLPARSVLRADPLKALRTD